jgi:hypothetical protein
VLAWIEPGIGDHLATPAQDVKDAWSGRGWRMLADKHGIEAFFHQLLAGPSNGVDAGIEGGGDSQSRHPSPVSEASAFSRMRALVSCRAGCFPARISVLSRSRSSSLSFTTYLFSAICFAVTKHLRHCRISESEICRRINDGGY